RQRIRPRAEIVSAASPLFYFPDEPPPKTAGTRTLTPMAKAPFQYFSVDGLGGLPPHFGTEPTAMEELHQTSPTYSPCVRRTSRPSCQKAENIRERQENEGPTPNSVLPLKALIPNAAVA